MLADLLRTVVMTAKYVASIPLSFAQEIYKPSQGTFWDHCKEAKKQVQDDWHSILRPKGYERPSEIPTPREVSAEDLAHDEANKRRRANAMANAEAKANAEFEIERSATPPAPVQSPKMHM